MTYKDLKKTFRKLKQDSPKEDMTAHIIFTASSFSTPYPVLSRTYRISSDNKAFWPHMGGYSIFGYCLDGTDQGTRLDWFMYEEGNYYGWEVEDCYILEQMQDAEAIPRFTRLEQKDGSVCCFFGDTCVHVNVAHEKDKIQLEPLDGRHLVEGDWEELCIDKLHGYCTLLLKYWDDDSELQEVKQNQ